MKEEFQTDKSNKAFRSYQVYTRTASCGCAKNGYNKYDGKIQEDNHAITKKILKTWTE